NGAVGVGEDVFYQLKWEPICAGEMSPSDTIEPRKTSSLLSRHADPKGTRGITAQAVDRPVEQTVGGCIIGKSSADALLGITRQPTICSEPQHPVGVLMNATDGSAG